MDDATYESHVQKMLEAVEQKDYPKAFHAWRKYTRDGDERANMIRWGAERRNWEKFIPFLAFAPNRDPEEALIRKTHQELSLLLATPPTNYGKEYMQRLVHTDPEYLAKEAKLLAACTNEDGGAFLDIVLQDNRTAEVFKAGFRTKNPGVLETFGEKLNSSRETLLAAIKTSGIKP